MSKTMRRMGLSLVVVAYIVVVIIFLVRDHKKGISSALGDSLDFIGSKLNAMVAESPDKKEATAAYEDFKKQVLDHKVPPEQVENIAANILNLSNSGVVISSSDAEEMLQSNFSVQIEGSFDSEDSLIINVSEMRTPKIAAYPQPQKPVTPEDLEKLNSRLSSIYAFEMKMNRYMKDKDKSEQEFRQNMYYDSKNGLKLVVDPKTKERLIKGEIAEIEIELKNLENEELLVYNKDIKKDLEKEKKKLEDELQFIIRSRHERTAEKAERNFDLRRLETIKKIRLMGLSRVHKDSLNKIIKKIEQESLGTKRTTAKTANDSTKKN